jgi:hypothetical protein
MRIGDDGVGLPDRTNGIDHETLGMDLIHTLGRPTGYPRGTGAGPGTVYELVSLQEERRKRA